MMHFECTGVGWQHTLSSDWGRCRRLVEVRDDQEAGRQIELYQNGCVLKYGRSHERDAHGQLLGLRFSKKDKWAKHFDDVRMLAETEFQNTWERTPPVVR
jgi:hypothetical protein